MKKKFNVKKLLVAALSLCMVLGVNVPNAKAASVETDVVESSGSYYYYVRKAGSADLLGRMYFEMNTASVKNTFTATVPCKTTTVYVSQSSASGSFEDNTVTSLSAGASVIVRKDVARPTRVYGKCKVYY